MPEPLGGGGEQVDRCACGRIRDRWGHHRLTCFQGDTAALTRQRAHAHVIEVLDTCCVAPAGLRSQTGGAVPPMRSTSTSKGDISIEVDIPPPPNLPRARGIIGDVGLVHPYQGNPRDERLVGTPRPAAAAQYAAHKTALYSGYSASVPSPWTFVPLITTTHGRLSPPFQRLLNFLACHQVAAVRDTEGWGEDPRALKRLFLSRSLSRVACGVAVGTAMKLGATWQDFHHEVRRHRLRALTGVFVDHELDVPLFPSNSGSDIPRH